MLKVIVAVNVVFVEVLVNIRTCATHSGSEQDHAHKLAAQWMFLAVIFV